jgi:arabinofuranosyltransferase
LAGVAEPGVVQHDPAASVTGRSQRRHEERLRRSRAWRHVALVVLVLSPALLLLVMGWRYKWIGDDGFINLRVVQQIGAGNGPVFNRGERVEAGTSPAWIALLAAADFLTPVRLEWLAVTLGLALAVTGVVLATLATLHLLPHPRRGPPLPLGALAFVALPATWTYATAGLEGGLSFAWIGASWFALTRAASSAPDEESRPDRPRLALVIIGLGPLVRPDFALVALPFLVAVLLVRRDGGWPARVRALGWALLVPVVAEILRAGYYGLLVPNTALAKEASQSYWSQGWRYLTDFTSTYLLVIPLLALAAATVVLVATAHGTDRRRIGVVVGAAATAGLALTCYWVRIGGDWMHARVLLPALLCLLLPTMVVSIRNWSWTVALVVVGWALVCATTMRPSAAGTHGIIDPRWSPAHLADGKQIVTLDDYRALTPADDSYWTRIRRFADAGGTGLLLFQPGTKLEPLPIVHQPSGAPKVIVRGLPIGLVSFAAGPDVYIADGYGLADPVGSHFELDHRGRPGHEKFGPSVWTIARFAKPGVELPLVYEAFFDPPHQVSTAKLDAARAALACADVRDLLEATRDDLTPTRFLENLFGSPRRTTFRLSGDPLKARDEVC